MQTTELRGVSLSVQQNRLWPFLQGNVVYRVQGAVWLEGDLDEDTFQRALRKVVEQHEILQTVFQTLAGMDVPVQVIGRCPLLDCSTVNLERFNPSAQHNLLDASYDTLQTQSFDLAHGPIFRSMLFRLSAKKHLLLVSLPSLCADASTLPLFIAELVQQYEAEISSDPLEKDPLQYSDVSAWQDELLELESAHLPRDFWHKIDLAQATQVRLPFTPTECTSDNNLAEARQTGFEPRSLSIAVDERQIARVCSVADTYDVTMTDVLLSCWQVALWRVLDETELVMGVACDGRDQEDLATALGPYTRFVSVGLSFGEYWTFAQVMATVSQSLRAANKWQSYFTWNDQGRQEGSNYFSIAFEHQTWPAIISGGPIAASLYRSSNCTEPFIVKLRVLQVGKYFQLELHYDPRLFSNERASRLSAVLLTLLQGAIEHPQAQVRDLPILGSNEQEQLIKLFQAPKQPFPISGFHQLFEEQARKTPLQIALLSADEQLTYQELNSRANQLARVLRRRGAGPRVPVGLCLPRSAQMIVIMLAIFKAGAAYVPLDPESPPARLAYQLQDVQPPLLITEQDLSLRLPQFDGQIVNMQMFWSEAAQENTSNLSVCYESVNPAYVIYTSGSTGVPKGVVVRQGSVVNYTCALCELLKPEPGWRFATVSTLAADLGNTAIFCALASGGCLHIPDYAIVTSPEAFARWGAQHQIDVLKIVPSHLSALLIGEHAREVLPRKALLLGGEVLPMALLERIRAQEASCVVYNHYGPTETTIGVLVNKVSTLDHSENAREDVRKSLRVPLGRPITNTDVYVLSPSLQVVPIGVAGELYIGGAGLAEGYLQQPEQTAERFVPHPFSEQPGDRLYRTGDLVRCTEQGQIEFLGRRDGQVKLRGYRIELGEIEAVLRHHNNVWDCAVVLREDGAGGPQLVGYVVARKQPGPTHAELHDFLRTRVPEYMIPSLFMTLKVLPLTANGKVNHRQLPKPEVSPNETKTVLTMPQGPIEEMLLDIWKDLLGVPEIDVHGNFFQLGGHSLLATQVISRVRATIQVELPIQSLFENPTIAELARQVERLMRGAEAEGMPPLSPADRTVTLPLSFAQQRLWFLDQLAPGGTTYLIPRARRIYGALDVAVLERSLEEIVRRHEDLRTTFQEQAGQPVQVIHPADMFCLPVIDLRGLASEEREHEARRLAVQEAQSPCNLAQGPLLRTSLLTLDTQDHVFLLTMHHIISDGWSNDVFERELTTLYQAFTAGKPSPLPPLPIQYADFALWQRQCLQGEMLETQLAYWKNQLANAFPLELPTDRPRPPRQTFRGASFSAHLPVTLQKGLIALSQQEGVTLFMLLLAAFQVLLMRYTGQDDICVGTPVANRTRAELEGLIGFFVNTLVLRTNLSGNPSFTEALQRVRKMALEAYLHQDVPFEYLVDTLQPERDLSRSPLFQVMFTMQHFIETATETVPRQTEKLSFGNMDSQHNTSKFDLTFSIISSGQNLHCGVEYNTDLFEADTIRRLLEHWQVLLESIVARPQTALSDLKLLSEEERHRLLVEWNPPAYKEARAECLHTLFEQQVVRRPEAVAVVCGEEALTYEHLNARANQLAHTLRRAGVGPGKMVGLVLERSPFLVIGILSTLKAGGAYIPLDPSYPAERLEFMLADSQVSVLLTQQSLMERVSTQGIPIICLDTDWSIIAESPIQDLLDTAEAERLAYVIYTSGSTGRPKGVMVNHANVFHLFAATQSQYHFNEDDVWTLFHSYAFDFSVWEIWGALLHGGQLVVVTYETSRTPEIFYALLYAHGVTVLNQTPSAFRQLMQVEASTEKQKHLALRLIIFGGEALDLQALRPWFSRHAEHMPRLVNMYGITETTVHVTYRPLGMQDVLNAAGSVIGVPIPSLQVYVLDEYLQPAPIGVPGQMYVGGSGLSSGYLNHPELTGERFIPHPFSVQSGMRLYKTGDLARFLHNGDLEYLGRIDQQVKIRGFRIELEEIEEALSQHSEIQECRVIAREVGDGDKRLVAYVIAHQNMAPKSSELRRFLLRTLPDYMVPAFFVALEEFPLTANGKLDQRALPLPGGVRPDLDEAFLLPRTTREEILAGIWSSVLGIEQVGVQDNFFALGGDSMRSIQVLSRARERGINFSLQQLFQHQTIYELAQVLETEENTLLPSEQTQPFSLITLHDRQRLPANVEDAYPLAALQAGMFFHSQYNPGSAVYHDIFSYHLQVPFNHRLLERAIQCLATCHPTMRTAFDLSSFSEPLQLVYLNVEIPLQVVDLRQFSFTEQDKILAAWLEEDKSRHFDWAHASLLRFQIHLRSAQSFQFTLSFHHAILDGWSVASLFTELFKTYRSLLRNDATPFPSPPAIQYWQFVALEQRLSALEEARHYWIEKLKDSTSVLLPRWTAPRQVAADSSNVYVLPIPISQETSANLKKLARNIAVPVKSVLLATHLRVLSLLYGQTDVLTGLVSNGRPETSDGERILGLFLNTLPFRVKLSGGRWVDLIRETFAAECELLPYRWYPLANIQRQQGGYELFEVIFNFIHFHVYEGLLETPGRTDDFQVLGRTGFEQTNFTLAANFSLDPVSSRVSLSLRCNTDELGLEQIKAIGSYYANTLASIANEPEERYELQSPLSVMERQQLLVDWNTTSVEYPREKCIHELFAEQVERTPEAVALVFEDAQLTYAELKRRANELAHHLRDLGVGPEVLVGIYMERSLEMLVSLLGVLIAGGAYVPLDPAYPPERLAFMIEDSQVAVLVTQPWLVDELPPHDAQVVCLSPHFLEHSVVDQRTCKLTNTAVSEQLAYVIYTSGSTGKPKGTAITHRAVSNFFNSMQRVPGIIAQDVMLAVTSLSFDIAILELVLPMMVGARVQIVSREVAADGAELARYLATSNATIMQATPTTWHMLLNEQWQGSGHLKMLCGGEVLPLELASQLRPRGVSLWNMYGPTETTIWSATGEVSGNEEQISIGRAIDNTQIYLLDDHFMPVPIGVPGTLYIGGDGLARGYLHRPEVSAEKFLPNPFSEQAGVRMYCTGDLARWLPDGTIECLGRNDRQVKVRGFRIELGEIETILGQHPALKECVVVAREDVPGEKQLVAYLVSRSKPGPSTSELRSHLQRDLPEYMVPSRFVTLDTLPLTPNGKIDRQALPTPEVQEEGLAKRTVVAARTPIEEALTEIWTGVLRRPLVSIYDNFFELGGHSLLATQLISRIRTVLQVELPLRSLFESPTVAGLAERVEGLLHSQQGKAVPPLSAFARPQNLPLSFAQQRLWFLDQLEPESTAYLMSSARTLQGPLAVRALERSLQEIAQRHETLRTTFALQDGQPLQIIKPLSAFHLPVVDLGGLPQQQRAEEAQRLSSQEAQCPCDLLRGPLMRTCLLRLEEQEHVLLLTMHHIISDAWSMQILEREVISLYEVFACDQPSPLPPLPIQYADFALWQRQWLQGERLDAQLAYWKQQLAEVSTLELPTDHPRPAVQTYRGTVQTLQLPATLQEQLLSLSRQSGVTLFMTLLAAFQVLLSRYSGQQDIAVGTPIANRPHAELEGLIGFFVNTLVLRSDLSGNPSFAHLLKRVREVALGAYSHQDLPFEYLVEALRPERDLSRPPLFQVMFAMQQAQEADELQGLQGLSIRGVPTDHTISKFDLSLHVGSDVHGLRCSIEYNTDLFERTTIQRLLVHWQTLLEGIVASPQTTLSDLPLLSEQERQAALLDWNATRVQIPSHPCLHMLFDEQVARTPDAIALVCREQCWSYQQLQQRANQLAHYLHQWGVGPDVLVGLCMERSLDLVVGLLGILKAGGAYVPLDPSYPRGRLAFMASDAHIRILLTQEHLRAQLPLSEQTQILCIDSDWRQIAKQNKENLDEHFKPEQLAYVLYTSGSTGTPKGVAIQHQNVIAFLAWARTAFTEADVAGVLASTSICFDLSVFELFLPLSMGGTVILAENILQLPTLPGAKDITLINTVPSVLTELLHLNALPSSVRIVNLAGEPLHLNLVQRVYQQENVQKVFNLYGPTEGTTYSTYTLVDRTSNGEPSIGHPIANTQAYLLDHALQLVPVGVPGELYIGGSGLARGYLHRPDLTAERFVPDTFSNKAGTRLYWTGDLARYRPDGNIEFLGRLDHQVKIRGFRIELDEIEALLVQHPAVRESVVMVLEKPVGNKRLVAYVVLLQADSQPTSSELRHYLQEQLPNYMIPNSIVLLKELPLTPNGKIDRRALPAPEDVLEEERVEQVALRSPIEELLAGIWSKLLGRSQVNAHDSFFELGGHSLLAAQLISRIRESLGIEVPLRSLFESPTVAGLAERVEGLLHSQEGRAVPPLSAFCRPQDLPLSFAQQRLWFLDQLDPGSPAYLMPNMYRFRETLDVRVLERSLNEVVRRHESLRTTVLVRYGQPVQIIHPVTLLRLPMVDLSQLGLEGRESEARRLIEQEAQHPMNLTQGPLLRVFLLRLDCDDQVLLWTMHHITSDGWSMQVFEREVVTLYQAFVCDQPSPLSPLPIQYADFALWQRQWLQGEVLEAQLDYWIARLSGVPALELPIDHPRPFVQSQRGAIHSFRLSRELSQALTTLSHQKDVTLFMILLAAFQVLLYRYTGQRDIVVGTDSANRNRVEVEGIIGLFVNLLALRVNLTGNPSFGEVLHHVREVVLGAYVHQETPFELLVEKLSPTRTLDRMPLVQALLVLQNFSPFQSTQKATTDFTEQELTPDPLQTEVTTVKFDLALFMREHAGQLYGRLNYNLDLFEASTIATMAARFETILHSIVRHPDGLIDSLDFLTEEERLQSKREEEALKQRLRLHKGNRFNVSR